MENTSFKWDADSGWYYCIYYIINNFSNHAIKI